MGSMLQTVRFKIILALGLCVVLMAVIGTFGAVGLHEVDGLATDMYQSNTVIIIDLGEVRSAQSDMRLQYRLAQAKPDDATIASATAAIGKDEARIQKAWNHYYPAWVTRSDERVIADKINAALPVFTGAADQTMAAFKAGKHDDAVRLIDQSLDGAEALSAALDEDVANNRAQAADAMMQVGSTYHTILTVAIILVVVGLLIAIVASIWLLRAVLRPLERAIGVAGEIAGGRLDNRLKVDVGGEFGQLLTALKTMDEQLSSTVRRIQASSSAVAQASDEIATGNLDLSSRTEEQAASLEETAASMTELTETVKHNAHNAKQANNLANGASRLADSGNDAVQAMVTTIGEISGNSSKISEITAVIEGIAFQTNILALNAAVEAARAGEQGRGFAVVASEVRSLAQRSAVSAKEIKELIGASVSMVEGGAKQAAEAGEAMGQVRQAIRRVSDIVAEIAAASEEQSRGIEQVDQAVTQMDRMTQQNAALVEEAAAAAQSLNEQARELSSAVSTFQLSEA
ncbi:MCP four helix bundle domain-containing protein [Rhodanobacter sp. 7MK24]|nr:MCP four helix bundle domain-containing protein [Rhodanobacter sp. 7MK24]